MEYTKIISYLLYAVAVSLLIAYFVAWIIEKIRKTEQEFICENCGHSEEVSCEKQAGRTVERARACSHDVED